MLKWARSKSGRVWHLLYGAFNTDCGLSIYDARDRENGWPEGKLCKVCVKLLKSRLTYQVDEALEVLMILKDREKE